MIHRLLGVFLCIPCLWSCVQPSVHDHPEKFVASKSISGLSVETSSIREFVFGLPPFSYHEASLEAAHDAIGKQEVSSRMFQGRSLESIRYEGDGSAGASTFYLDRNLRQLWQYYHAWEPFSSDSISRYRVVEGGWMVSQYDATETDRAEQAVSPKSDRAGG